MNFKGIPTKSPTSKPRAAPASAIRSASLSGTIAFSFFTSLVIRVLAICRLRKSCAAGGTGGARRDFKFDRSRPDPGDFRSHTNQANGIALKARAPAQPSRCIIGRRLRKTCTRASPRCSRTSRRRIDSKKASRRSR